MTMSLLDVEIAFASQWAVTFMHLPGIDMSKFFATGLHSRRFAATEAMK